MVGRYPPIRSAQLLAITQHWPAHPELIATDDRDGWLTGNASFLFRSERMQESPTYQLIRHPLPTLSPSEVLTTYDYDPLDARARFILIIADDDAVFLLDQSGDRLRRIDLHGSAEATRGAPSGARFSHLVLAGAWIYASASPPDELGPVSVYRTRRDLSEPLQELLPSIANVRAFAVISDSLVYSDGERFWAKRLPRPSASGEP